MRFVRNFDPNQKADLKGRKKKIFEFFFFLNAELNSENGPQCRFSNFFLVFSLKLKSLKKNFFSF
jgi:hypothetical protein